MVMHLMLINSVALSVGEGRGDCQHFVGGKLDGVAGRKMASPASWGVPLAPFSSHFRFPKKPFHPTHQYPYVSTVIYADSLDLLL